MTVGLAGKACAGKDSLVPFFLERGFTVIDADRIGHEALEANAEAVRARFSTLDRNRIGRIVFSDPGALADLEALTHPWIAERIRQQRAAAPGDAVLNVPLLHKQQLYRLCDVVVWVEAPLLVRLWRARRRDGWSWGRILRRIWAQRKLGPQVFPPDVDILRVDNRGILRAARTALEARFGRGTAFSKKEDTHEKQ